MYLVGRDAGGVKVSALWETKSWNEKKRYRDVDYLTTLRETITDAPPSTVPNPETVAEDIVNAKRVARLNGRVQISKVSQQATLTMVTDWVRKLEADVGSDFSVAVVENKANS